MYPVEIKQLANDKKLFKFTRKSKIKLQSVRSISKLYKNCIYDHAYARYDVREN